MPRGSAGLTAMPSVCFPLLGLCDLPLRNSVNRVHYYPHFIMIKGCEMKKVHLLRFLQLTWQDHGWGTCSVVASCYHVFRSNWNLLCACCSEFFVGLRYTVIAKTVFKSTVHPSCTCPFSGTYCVPSACPHCSGLVERAADTDSWPTHATVCTFTGIRHT